MAKGLEDFRVMPTHVVFLSLIYPIVGIALGSATFGYDVIPLLFPLAAGFALIGPFAAIGLYELSRRRELGLDTAWKRAFDIVHSPSFGAIVTLGFLLMVGCRKLGHLYGASLVSVVRLARIFLDTFAMFIPLTGSRFSQSCEARFAP